MTVIPTALDTELRAAAQSTLGEFGITATFHVQQVREYDPTLGKTIEAGPLDYVLKVAPPSPFDQRMVNGDTIQTEDMRTLAAGLDVEDAGFTPTIGQTVTVGGMEWRVTYVAPIYSGELVAAYRLGLRR